jgi:hypothetical protein
LLALAVSLSLLRSSPARSLVYELLLPTNFSSSCLLWQEREGGVRKQEQ